MPPHPEHHDVINAHLLQNVSSPPLRIAAAGALLRMARCPKKFFGIGDATHEVMKALCDAGILSSEGGSRKYRCKLAESDASALATCRVCPDGFLVPPSPR